MLLHCLGPEGQRVFYTLPPSPSSTPGDAAGVAADGADILSDTPCTYNEALKRLDSQFTPAVNVDAERYRFRQRGQRHDEPVDDYISLLRALSVNCEFGNLRDEFIRDQLVEKTICGRIRKRLLSHRAEAYPYDCYYYRTSNGICYKGKAETLLSRGEMLCSLYSILHEGLNTRLTMCTGCMSKLARGCSRWHLIKVTPHYFSL